MSLRDQLQAVYEQAGRLTPQTVVEAARPKNHPLHTRFEWNDRIAGEAYRRQQAQELIQSVKIVHSRDDKPDLTVRAFHAVRDGEGFAYKPTDEILSDPLLTKMLLADMNREWLTLRQRYEHFIEFRELVLGDLGIAQ